MKSNLLGLLAVLLCVTSGVPVHAQISIGCGQTLSGAITTPSQQDTYAFNGTAGEAVILTAAATSGSMEALACLHGPTGNVIGCNSPNGMSTSFTLATTGTYTIIVRDFFTDEIGTYNLNLQFATGRCGAGLSCGQTSSAALVGRAEQDAYSFGANAGEAVLFAAVATSGSHEPLACLYRPSGTIVGCNSPNGGSVSFTLPTTGTYTIVVGDFFHDEVGTYDLNLQFTTGRCGTRLTCQQPLQGSLASVAEQDSFTFTANGGDAATIAAVATSGNIQALACLYTPAGVVRGCNSPNGTSASFSLPTTGTYTIVVGDFFHDGAGAYTVSLAGTGSVCTPGPPPPPPTTFTRYLAEGATGSFFDMSIALLNIDPAPTIAMLRFLKHDGSIVNHGVTVNGRSRLTVNPETIPGLEDANFSTAVTSTLPLVVDRTMTWGANRYGSHAETSVAAPSTTWYLAEGSTSGEFALFYLLQNPTAAAITATVTYLLPFGQVPIVRTYLLPANSRTTIAVDGQGPELASTDVSAIVTATQPIIVERAMYLSRPGQPFAAGHDSVGVTAPALEWFLAEGATGPFFELFVLIANPNPTAAEISADYLLTNGTVLTKTYTVPANGRFTIWVDEEELPAGTGTKPLMNVALSTTVRSTNNVPVIVERAMWWPQPVWHEAHNSPGATVTGTRWALADGELGGSQGHETYILIANTSPIAGQARVTLFFEDGTTQEKTFPLVARSRTNVQVSQEFQTAFGKRFGALVETLGSPAAEIVVERAMYSNAGGVVWAAGTNALGTRLP
jgi:hypothetical protein